MKKMLLSGMFAVMMVFSLFAQNPDRKPMPSADRAKATIDKIAQTVTLSDTQKADMTGIYTKFYDDARAQQAFRDPSKLEPLEKDRDVKVKKLLKNPKLYQQYEDAVKMLKAEMQQRQHQQPKP